jgi:glutamate--cysteine ligase
VPKGRYVVMRDYLPTRGRLGHDMMKRTATVQANLDYADEEDAEQKMRAALSVTSLVTALFANSPLAEGRDTGYASYRARAWLDTDPDRCGLLPFAFERGRLFQRYAEWALDVPMFFVYRHAYVPAGGMTFRRFLREGFEGDRATLADWELHLSTLFPEVRLKHYLEMRGADSGPRPMVLALPALWKGLLYDDEACAQAERLTHSMTFAERLALRDAVPRAGLSAVVGSHPVRELARELVGIARTGLTRVAPDEVPYLAPLEEVVATGRTPADRVRDAWTQAAGDPVAFLRAVAY